MAKLFASESNKETEYKTIYKALNQSLNAMLYLRRRGSIIPSQGKIKRTVEIPVILCNSFEDFYQLDMENEDDPKPINNDSQLEVNYAYVNRSGTLISEYFLIDIVSFDTLDSYLSALDQDLDAMSHMLRDD